MTSKYSENEYLYGELQAAHGELQETYRRLKDAHIEMIFRMALISEYRHHAMGTHLVRITDYSAVLAEGLGLLSEEVEIIRYASPMHDIGKIMLPDSILNKKGKLTDEEANLMREHPRVGADIFKNAKSPLLKACRTIALTHHERYDGKGYPAGIKGEEIPLYGRIVALADCFDAFISKRTYKEAYSFDKSVSMIKERAGGHFDPVLVDVFEDNKDKIKQIFNANRDIDDFLENMGIVAGDLGGV
ncbi:MAG: HD domain-containing phosphohydrolase [Candidatus Tantalella remota]|nr:HD domain-containing phosphohydrolase [Candidatus Tantalella remota]